MTYDEILNELGPDKLTLPELEEQLNTKLDIIVDAMCQHGVLQSLPDGRYARHKASN